MGETHTVESYQIKLFRISLNKDATIHLLQGTLNCSEERCYDKHWIFNQYHYVVALFTTAVKLTSVITC